MTFTLGMQRGIGYQPGNTANRVRSSMSAPSLFDLSLRPGARRSRSAHDATVEAIGRAIVDGRLPVGAILPSKEVLMGQLDVSLTTLREALQTITAKGMLAAKARVGTRVLPKASWNMFDSDVLAWHAEDGQSPDFLASLLEIRQAIEPVAAALAAARRSEDDVARLRALVTLLDVNTTTRARFVEADVAFHQRILSASGNPFMQSIAAMIGTALSTALDISAPRAQTADGLTVQQQHAAIAEAIAAGDAQGAAAAMTAVIREGWVRNPGYRAEVSARLEIAPFERD